MTKLVTFGDSWPCGAELLPDEKPYGKILSDLLSLNFENRSQTATSNEHMVLQLKRYIDSLSEDNKTVAVFFITSPARTCLIDFNGTEKEIYPWADQSRGAYANAWYRFFHTPLQDQFRTRLAILALQRMCNLYSIDDYYIVGWSQIDLDFPGIDKTKIYNKTCAELFDAPSEHEFSLAKDNQYIYPNNCHPNQKGHNLIAETLAEWINK
jgi:hypothetical protein